MSTQAAIFPRHIRVLAIVVLYKRKAMNSPCLRSLVEAQNTSGQLPSSIVLWDNTPGGQDPGPLPEGVRYRAAPGNPGLAAAYNEAIAADAGKHQWLLTLDQDTVLPADFLAKMKTYAADATPDTAAIVPVLHERGRALSPYRMVAGIWPRWIPAGWIGRERGVLALNSGSLLRIEAVKAVGGYDTSFPLDMSDLSLYRQFAAAGRSIAVAGDVLLDHELSLLDKGSRLDSARYRQSLRAETAFYDLYMSPLARAERCLRLAGRWWRDRTTPSLLPFRQATLQELRRRLFVPRRQRLKQWHNALPGKE